MKNLIKKISVVTFVLVVTSFAFIGYAQIEAETPGGDNGVQEQTGSFDKLQNPLQNSGIDDIPKLVRTILDIVLTIAVPIIAVAIIYTGFLFIAAQGNPEKLKVAKDTLLYVLIGAAVLLAAYVIAEAIESTVRAITG